MRALLSSFALAAVAVACSAEPAPPASAESPLTAFAPPAWENGTTCGTRPDVEVYKHAEGTYVFRQSICTTFEAPFIYLLLGEKKALLLDTGNRRDDGGGLVDLKTPVERAIAEFTAAKGLAAAPELVVAHTHSHGDHVSGDPQFKARPRTTVVGLRPRDVATFFGLAAWPEGKAAFDLGGRTLDVVPIPGHEPSHIAVYDRATQFLFTGDTLYPGRLYVSDWRTYRTSAGRLASWLANEDVPVRAVLGAHVEMNTRPGQDYPFQASVHLDEHAMHQPRERVFELSDAMQELGSQPQRSVHPDFIIFPL